MNPTPMEVEPPPHMQQTFQRPPIPGSHYAAGQMPMQPAGLNGPPFPSRPAGQPMPPPMTQPHPSSHPSQAQPNQPQRRIQTPADLKTLLMNQLKEGFPKYFDLLKQFVNGKVTKPEFESELRKILPEKLVAIHNMFMMTILRSAYIATLRHRKTKTGPRSPYGKRGLPDPLGRREHRTTTEYSTLKSKMEKIARGAGLTNMQPECVPLMLTALDHVLTAFMYKSDVNRAKRTLPGPKYMFENDVTNDGGNIVDLNHVAQYGNNGYVTPVIGPSSPSPLQMGVPTEYITNPASMRGMEVVEVHNTVTRDDLVQALRQRPQLQLIGSNMVTVAELLHSYEE